MHSKINCDRDALFTILSTITFRKIKNRSNVESRNFFYRIFFTCRLGSERVENKYFIFYHSIFPVCIVTAGTAAEKGYFGPWRQCKFLLYGREWCGQNNISRFQPVCEFLILYMIFIKKECALIL